MGITVLEYEKDALTEEVEVFSKTLETGTTQGYQYVYYRASKERKLPPKLALYVIVKKGGKKIQSRSLGFSDAGQRKQFCIDTLKAEVYCRKQTYGDMGENMIELMDSERMEFYKLIGGIFNDVWGRNEFYRKLLETQNR